MGWYSKKPGKAPWLSALIIIALACLMGACGTTGPGTGGGAGAGTATPGSSPAPVATRTAYDRSGCAGQAGLLSIRMLDSSQGWALNENAVLKTFDGGLHWHCATPTSMRPGMTAGGTFIRTRRKTLCFSSRDTSRAADRQKSFALFVQVCYTAYSS